MIKYHIIALFGGFLLDLLVGDPHWMPHPIRLIGSVIAKCSKWNRAELKKGEQFWRGMAMTILVVCLTAVVAAAILVAGYWLHPFAGCIIEGIMTYQILATKCLKVESMKVYKALKKDDLEGARYAVSMIVGRDTQVLDATGVAKAAVETVAENTSDGVIAPLIYLAIGGPILGFMYKAINTMDSMVGYKNEQYINFGKIPAKIDDIFNFIPSRFTALLMIVSSFILGLDGKNAYKIWRRDRFNHASPNSAQTESVCAGALNIRLAGDAYYFGKLYKKKTIGDNNRPIENDDIKKSNRLMYCTSVLMLAVTVILRIIIAGCFL